VGAAPDGVHDQVQGPVPVDIHEGCARGVKVCATNTRFLRDVLELPVSQVAIKVVARLKAAEIEVAPAIAIDIAGGNTGTIGQNLAGQRPLLRQGIGKNYAGLFWREQCETLLAGTDWVKPSTAISRPVLPIIS